jgi:glucose/arabinose dehydrogenase
MRRALTILTALVAAASGATLLRADTTLRSALHDYRVVTVVDALVQPWSIAFLPGGDLLITERPGRLRIVRQGKLLPQAVEGVPKVFHSSQGGLLEVMPHPNFASNRLIYLTYSKPGAIDSQAAAWRTIGSSTSSSSSRRWRRAAIISAGRSRSTGRGTCS